MSLEIAPDRLREVTPEMAAKGAVGARSSRIFRSLAVEQPNKSLYDGTNHEALRRHLTVQTHVGGYVHRAMFHAYSDIRPDRVSPEGEVVR